MINDFTLSWYRFTQDQLAHLNVKIVYNANSTVYSAEGWKFERDARDYRTSTVTRHGANFRRTEQSVTENFVQTGPFNILALFTRNVEQLGVQTPLRGGGVLPSNRLMGICRLVGSLFHGWIGYYGVAFIRLTRMGPQIFGIWGIRKFG